MMLNLMLPKNVDEYASGALKATYKFQFELKTSDGKHRIPLEQYPYDYSIDREDYFKVKDEQTSSQAKFVVQELNHYSKKTKFTFSIAGIKKEIIFR